jgi:hypothetical protein
MEEMLMFNKLFDGILDICKPGTDDPMCQFGGPLKNSNQQSKPPVTEKKSNGIWQKVKNLGRAGSAMKS